MVSCCSPSHIPIVAIFSSSDVFIFCSLKPILFYILNFSLRLSHHKFILFVLILHINAIVKPVFFACGFCISKMLVSLIHAVLCINCSFLNCISLYEYTTICFPMFLLMDIWVLYSFYFSDKSCYKHSCTSILVDVIFYFCWVKLGKVYA